MIRYKNYVIEPNYNGGYVLSKEKKYKEYKEGRKEDSYLEAICYPSTLQSAIQRIRDLEFAKKIEEKDYTLDEAIKLLNKMNEELKELIKG